MSDAGIDANDAPDKPAEGAKEKEKSHAKKALTLSQIGFSSNYLTLVR